MKKTELQVNIHCQKVKTKVLKAVTKLAGVDEVSVDSEKGIITVVGHVDPVKLAAGIRKTGICAEIISVGPPKKPDPPKPDVKAEKPPPPPPSCHCNQCQLVAVVGYAPYDNGSPCSIL